MFLTLQRLPHDQGRRPAFLPVAGLESSVHGRGMNTSMDYWCNVTVRAEGGVVVETEVL
jgi:hypothetical protein